jgi:hypothetical protein
MAGRARVLVRRNVVNTTVYVVSNDPKDLPDVWSIVRQSGLRIKPHTSTLLGVAVLGYTGQLVEITAVPL